MSVLLWIATAIGAVILVAVATAVIMLTVALTAWAATLAVTWRPRTGTPVPRQPVRAPRDVWEMRWSRFLRTVLRNNHKISGEREHIARMRWPAFLWADDAYRPPERRPATMLGWREVPTDDPDVTEIEPWIVPDDDLRR